MSWSRVLDLMYLMLGGEITIDRVIDAGRFTHGVPISSSVDHLSNETGSITLTEISLLEDVDDFRKGLWWCMWQKGVYGV